MRWEGRLAVSDTSLLPFIGRMEGLVDLTVPGPLLESWALSGKPESLHVLRVTDMVPSSFDFMEGWEDLITLDLNVRRFHTGWQSLQRAFPALENLRIASVTHDVIDLGILPRLSHLRILQLSVPDCKFIKLEAFTQHSDVTIYVPSGVAVVGRDALSRRSQLKIMPISDFPVF